MSGSWFKKAIVSTVLIHLCANSKQTCTDYISLYHIEDKSIKDAFTNQNSDSLVHASVSRTLSPNKDL